MCVFWTRCSLPSLSTASLESAAEPFGMFSEQRIKRAFDASAKRKTIHPENQPKEVFDVSALFSPSIGRNAHSNLLPLLSPPHLPRQMYLEADSEQAQLDREERAILNSY